MKSKHLWKHNSKKLSKNNFSPWSMKKLLVAVFFLIKFFTAFIYTCIQIHFRYTDVINLNLLREQLCNLSLHVLYKLSVQ
jgi:hypothetical protein